MRMDKALLLVFGGIAVVFALIPDQKPPSSPATTAPATPPVVGAPVEPEPAPYVAPPTREQQDPSAGLHQADDDDGSAAPVHMPRQSLGNTSPNTSPNATPDVRRAQALHDEAVYQVQHRGS
jgi:hypothetical protein